MSEPTALSTGKVESLHFQDTAAHTLTEERTDSTLGQKGGADADNEVEHHSRKELLETLTYVGMLERASSKKTNTGLVMSPQSAVEQLEPTSMSKTLIRKRKATIPNTNSCFDDTVDDKRTLKRLRRSTIKAQSAAATAKHANITRDRERSSEAGPSEQKATDKQSTKLEANNVPIILPSLSRLMMEKVYAMRTFINLVDNQAGISYANIDADGKGHPTRTRMLAREFLAALQAIAADLELKHPKKVAMEDGGDMVSLEVQTMKLGGQIEWAVVDFTETNEIESKAQELIGDRGFRGRSIVGIECCMQAWHQAQRVAAAQASVAFRPENFAGDSMSRLAAGYMTWSEAQKQGQKEVEDMLRRNRDHVDSQESLIGSKRTRLASASQAYLQHFRPWLPQAVTSHARFGEELISPKSIPVAQLKPLNQAVETIKKGVCPPPPTDFV